MTEIEAIKLLKSNQPTSRYIIVNYLKLNEALKMAINALEKQMPKKLINTCQYVSGCCPNCKKYISDWLEYNEFMCCPYCGQKLDWSEE